ncbi:DUF2284 domain-containing protein [Desulfosporosinus sp. BG]|uniref:DUF2284 domain-containing protein n=1 Tax=Desulfosporosinus sp. BG TaxID=1633135 RepID=UPI00083AC634|nr:DUF2284 domain-containing protein [Desulfosporosinus sp. BG]ODA39421.1 hypothetical protein DSBG_3806 [Desulfosporosinus sp. BG]
MDDHASQVDKTKLSLDELVQIALQIGAGIIDVVVIPTSDILVEEDLANMCREPRCAFYGLSANCPPYVSGPSGFRKMMESCTYTLAIKIDVPTGWLMSDERLVIMRLLHEIVADIERSAVERGYSNSKAFAAGSCKEIFCNKQLSCRMLTNNGPCRNPQYARPSIEAYGVNVHELTKTTGWFINPRDSNEANIDKAPIAAAIYGLVLIG